MVKWYRGPFAGHILQQLSANVVKLKNVVGGVIGRVSPYFGESIFVSLNAGKKCLSVDLKTRERKEIFYELVKRSDVLLENLSPYAPKNSGLRTTK